MIIEEQLEVVSQVHQKTKELRRVLLEMDNININELKEEELTALMNSLKELEEPLSYITDKIEEIEACWNYRPRWKGRRVISQLNLDFSGKTWTKIPQGERLKKNARKY